MIFSLTLFACFFTNCFSVYYCEMDKEKCDSLDNSQTISSSIYSGDYCGGSGGDYGDSGGGDIGGGNSDSCGGGSYNGGSGG